MLEERKKISSQKVFQGETLWLEQADYQFSRGMYFREIIHRMDAAAVVPIDKDDNVYLVKQFREAVDKPLIEIPAGLIDNTENSLECIKRELIEEAGLIAKNWVKLSQFYPTPGYSDEQLHLYMATDLKVTNPQPEEEEEFELLRIPISKSLEMIKEGQIVDSKTIIGITLAALQLRE